MKWFLVLYSFFITPRDLNAEGPSPLNLSNLWTCQILVLLIAFRSVIFIANSSILFLF